MFKYIDKIGVELEGGWTYRPDDLGVDISVKILPEEFECDHPCHCYVCMPDGNECGVVHTGEVRSRPYKSWHILKWMDENYPEYVNDTCGMHIHISLKSKKSYILLMEPKFYATFLREVERFAEANIPKDHYFWKRFAGAEKYCQRKFSPNQQIGDKRKVESRRTHLNYCYALHGTLENRLFPMFGEFALAAKCLKWYSKFVETYLENNTEDIIFERELDIPKIECNNLFSVIDNNREFFPEEVGICV